MEMIEDFDDNWSQDVSWVCNKEHPIYYNHMYMYVCIYVYISRHHFPGFLVCRCFFQTKRHWAAHELLTCPWTNSVPALECDRSDPIGFTMVIGFHLSSGLRICLESWLGIQSAKGSSYRFLAELDGYHPVQARGSTYLRSRHVINFKL